MDYAALSAEHLVRACTHSEDTGAWEEFVRRFHRLIATVAWRVAGRWGDVSPQVIDDLVQETYLKLCADNSRILRSFKPNHPDAFYGFLKTVTANLVHDYFKGARSAKRGSGTVEFAADPQIGPLADSSDAALVVKSDEREILLRELDTMLCKLVQNPHLERDRRIFWLYYRVGLTAGAIAALPSIGLKVKGVESTIERLTRLLRQETRKEPARKREAQT